MKNRISWIFESAQNTVSTAAHPMESNADATESDASFAAVPAAFTNHLGHNEIEAMHSIYRVAYERTLKQMAERHEKSMQQAVDAIFAESDEARFERLLEDIDERVWSVGFAGDE